MRPRPASSIVAVLAPLLCTLALCRCSCDGPECQVAGPKPEGCSCTVDVDCATNGGVLICLSGKCTLAGPLELPLVSCEGDDACRDGERCLGGACQAAPTCQFLHAPSDNTLPFRTSTGLSGALDVAHDGCATTLSSQAPSLEIKIKTIALEGGATLDGGCSDGFWAASAAAGVFTACSAAGEQATVVVAGGNRAPCFQAGDCAAATSCVHFDNPLDPQAGVCR